MKKLLLITCIFALAMTACRKPEPGINPNSETTDTTETIVKKYLVKALLHDDPNRIKLSIDWNDDCTKLLHVKYGLGYGSIIDYDFIYYGNDSVQVTWSVADSLSTWSFWYDHIMIHFREDKIDSICCYVGNVLKDVEHYYYDNKGNLIRHTYFDDGVSDEFYWDGEDVIECKMYGCYSSMTIDSFTNYIHPHYTLPYYLSNEVAFEIRQPLFNPLWKHQPVLPNYTEYEADADGYITKMIHKDSSDTLEKCITFYYKTPNQL